ncbi:MAG: hypothetical protein ACE5ES_02745 [Candidatus Nanoarchaeia archaeon]
MSFSLKYRSIKLESGKTLHRPLVPLTIIGRKERLNVFATLDSGSDLSIIPKEIAEVLDVEYTGDNEVSGISGKTIKTKEGRIRIIFGKSREKYSFIIPILIPIERENAPIILGRVGFFNQFKIIFLESEKRIEFKKYNKKRIFS